VLAVIWACLIDWPGVLCHDDSSLISLMNAHGSFDKVFDGVHDNVLRIKYSDPTMEKVCSSRGALMP